MNQFEFNFSLEVLNHLGRGLYRNFTTVIAEVVSNSWDAEATKVHINIDSDKKMMTIQDNGKGMDGDEFVERFLNIGYTRRKDKENVSKRKVLGRKGIGKLAVLSASNKVTIITKKKDSEHVGGVIDNGELDEQIEKKDGKYKLGPIDQNKKYFKDNETGTIIEFSDLKTSMNKPKLIKKYLAVLFNFSFSFPEQDFKIYVNGKVVSHEDLAELNEHTQYFWTDQGSSIREELKKRFNKNSDCGYFPKLEPLEVDGIKIKIGGYIAATTKPSYLKIRGTDGDFKAGLHLFVNGRLRQEDIFKDITSQRVVESYLYGEIHVDGFDNNDDKDNDIFTSNREGVIKDDQRYIEFLKELKKIQSVVLNDWGNWRREENEEKIKKNPKWPYELLAKDIKLAVDKFIKLPEDEKWKEYFYYEFMPRFLPKREMLQVIDPKTNKRSEEPVYREVFISHSSENKTQADFIHKLLLDCGFKPKHIFYSSDSDPNSESVIPPDTNLYDHIKKFYVNNLYRKPTVFFVISSNFYNSWDCCLEAGASWVTTESQKILVLDRKPKRPLNDDNHMYIEWKNLINDDNTLYRIFRAICKQHGKPKLDSSAFKSKVKELELLSKMPPNNPE